MWNLTGHYPRLNRILRDSAHAAGEWVVSQMKEWGLSNAHLEKWSTKDVPSGPIPGWQVTKSQRRNGRAHLHADHRNADRMDRRHRRQRNR